MGFTCCECLLDEEFCGYSEKGCVGTKLGGTSQLCFTLSPTLTHKIKTIVVFAPRAPIDDIKRIFSCCYCLCPNSRLGLFCGNETRGCCSSAADTSCLCFHEQMDCVCAKPEDAEWAVTSYHGSTICFSCEDKFQLLLCQYESACLCCFQRCHMDCLDVDNGVECCGCKSDTTCCLLPCLPCCPSLRTKRSVDVKCPQTDCCSCYSQNCCVVGQLQTCPGQSSTNDMPNECVCCCFTCHENKDVIRAAQAELVVQQNEMLEQASKDDQCLPSIQLVSPQAQEVIRGDQGIQMY